MLSRTRVQRRAVRFPVRFWRPSEWEERFLGYATNVSDGGLFIATRQPLPPKALVDLEVEQDERKLYISAEVVHAARFPPLYQQVFKSGMGVRFRVPEEVGVREVAALGVTLSDRRKYSRGT